MTDNDPSKRLPPLTIKEAVSFIDQEMKLWFAGRGKQAKQFWTRVAVVDVVPQWSERWDAKVRHLTDEAGGGELKVCLHDPVRGGHNLLVPLEDEDKWWISLQH